MPSQENNHRVAQEYFSKRDDYESRAKAARKDLADCRASIESYRGQISRLNDAIVRLRTSLATSSGSFTRREFQSRLQLKLATRSQANNNMNAAKRNETRWKDKVKEYEGKIHTNHNKGCLALNGVRNFSF